MNNDNKTYRSGDQITDHSRNTKSLTPAKLKAQYNSEEFKAKAVASEAAHIKGSPKVAKMKAFWDARDLLSNLDRKAIEQKEIKLARLGFKILIVEAVPALCEIYKDFLEDYGFSNIDVVHDGREALFMCKEKDYDLVLCNYNVPSVDGYRLSRALNMMCHLANFVMISGYDTNQFRNLKKAGIIALPISGTSKVLASICTLASGYYTKQLNQKIEDANA